MGRRACSAHGSTRGRLGFSDPVGCHYHLRPHHGVHLLGNPAEAFYRCQQSSLSFNGATTPWSPRPFGTHESPFRSSRTSTSSRLPGCWVHWWSWCCVSSAWSTRHSPFLKSPARFVPGTVGVSR